MVQSGRTLCGDAGALDHAPRRALPQGSAFRGFDIFETEARREQKAMRINFGSTQMEFDAPLTVYDAAVAAGLISRAVLAAHVNGKLCALTQMLDDDAREERIRKIVDAIVRRGTCHIGNEEFEELCRQEGLRAEDFDQSDIDEIQRRLDRY